MCCGVTILALLGPRAAGVVWWLMRPGLWNMAFSSMLWPILGIILLPWATLMYMLVFAFSGPVSGFGWVWVGLGALADIASYGGGAYGNKEHIPYRTTPGPL